VKVCYVGGCGRLGFPMAMWTASRGIETVIADKSKTAVQRVQRGDFSCPEPHVEGLGKLASETLTATTDTVQAVLESDLVFVLVQTPSLEDGSFSIEHVLSACNDIGAALKESDGYKVITIASTVMPGHINGPIRERLEAVSGKRAHDDFGLCYSPEFIRQGSIVEDFAMPSFVLIGSEHIQAADLVQIYYETTTANQPVIHHTSIVSAEIAKIGLNTAIVTKVAVANQLALLCHEIEGASANDVLRVIGSDPRIGRKYFSAGSPTGGPCFPRDHKALGIATQQRGLNPGVSEEIVAANRRQLEFVAAKAVEQGETIGVLGLTYKPDVALFEGSQGIELIEILGENVRAYDPAIAVEQSARTLEELVDDSDVLVLMTCWDEFRRLSGLDLSGKAVLDMWGFYDAGTLNCDVYIEFGEG